MDWHFKRGIVDTREERIYPFSKNIESVKIQRQFNKETSVFHKWNEDKISTLTNCIENDQNHWKAVKMKFEMDDMDATIELLTEHYAEVKEIITWLQSRSPEYPVVNMVDFTKFIKSCDICDENLSSSRIDTLYMASTLDHLRKQQSMTRWSFLEFLVRLAKEKFIETG